MINYPNFDNFFTTGSLNYNILSYFEMNDLHFDKSRLLIEKLTEILNFFFCKQFLFFFF